MTCIYQTRRIKKVRQKSPKWGVVCVRVCVCASRKRKQQYKFDLALRDQLTYMLEIFVGLQYQIEV